MSNGEVETRTISVGDRRELCVKLAGEHNGKPILVHSGSPNSRHLHGEWIADAEHKGIRLISYDRPGYGGGRPVLAAYLRVSPPDHDECDCDQGGGEGHEDPGLDELKRPEPVAGLVGRERSVAKARRACECGAYLAFSRVA